MAYRRRGKVKCAENEELVQGLQGLKAEVAPGNRVIHVYSKAIRSISAHPDPIMSGREALTIKGVGPFVGRKIDAILRQLGRPVDTVSASQPTSSSNGIGGAAKSAGRPLGRSATAAAAPSPGPVAARPPQAPSLVRANTAPTTGHRRTYAPRYGKAPWIVLMAAWTAVTQRKARGLQMSIDVIRPHFDFIEQRIAAAAGADRRRAELREVWRPATVSLETKGLFTRTAMQEVIFTDEGYRTADMLSQADKAFWVRRYGVTAGDVRPPSLSPEAVAAEQRRRVALAAAGPDPALQLALWQSNGGRGGGGAGAGGGGGGSGGAGQGVGAGGGARAPKRRSGKAKATVVPLPVLDVSGARPRPRKRRRIGGAGAAGARGDEEEDGAEGEEEVRWTTRTGPPKVLERWELVLLLDNREVIRQDERDFITNRLRENGITVVVRGLKLGDMMWIVRRRGTSGLEFVTNYLIERKQTADLEMSIRDGRYEEQKLRMTKCGLSNMIYLVEGSASSTRLGRGKSVPFAMIASKIFSGMHVHHTTSIEDTIRYLCVLHRNIEALLGDDAAASVMVRTRHDAPAATMADLADLAGRAVFPERLVTYNRWALLNSRGYQRTMSLVFGQQLCQVKGLGTARAEAILAAYPTAKSFADEMRRQPSQAAALQLLRGIPTSGMKLGPALCKTLYQFYRCPDYTAFVPVK